MAHTKKQTKTSFLRKDLSMKNIGTKSLNFAIRGGSAIAASAGSNALSNFQPKLHGPLAMALGLAGEILIENDQLRAVTEGLGVWGSVKTAQTFLPLTVTAKLGLGAADASKTEEKEVIDSTPNWDLLARESGLNEQEEENGYSEDDETDLDEAIFQAEEAQNEIDIAGCMMN